MASPSQRRSWTLGDVLLGTEFWLLATNIICTHLHDRAISACMPFQGWKSLGIRYDIMCNQRGCFSLRVNHRCKQRGCLSLGVNHRWIEPRWIEPRVEHNSLMQAKRQPYRWKLDTFPLTHFEKNPMKDILPQAWMFTQLWLFLILTGFDLVWANYMRHGLTSELVLFLEGTSII